jgi:hypothetical protein
MTQLAKAGSSNAQSALAAANDLRATIWRQYRKIAGCEAALGSRLHLLRDTATGIKLLTAMGLEHKLLNREERQKWDPNRGIRPDRQRLSLISCRFGLNSFLNIDRSVK